MKKIIWFIFIIYILIILKLTIFRFNVHYAERQLNLTLFADLIKTYKNTGIQEFLRLFLGNIGWFVPFGFLLPILLKRKNILTVIIWGAVFSFCIETTQFIFRKGVAELDDLILNVVGVVIGYFMYTVFAERAARAQSGLVS